jgi:hypothetical protein
MLFDDSGARGLDILRLVAKEAGRLDQLFELGQRRGGERRGIWKTGEQRRRDHIHPDIRALRRKDRGDQKLQRRVVRQSTLRVGVVLLQQPNQAVGMFLPCV